MAFGTALLLALLLYFVFSRRVAKKDAKDCDEGGDSSKSGRSVKRWIVRPPAQAPATWTEKITTLFEMLRFTYSESLGKWTMFDVALGIDNLMRKRDDFNVANVYTGRDSIQLKGPEVIADLNTLLRLLTQCMLFSKEPFPVFLKSAGYTQEEVLLQRPKSGLLKPAFTIIRDENSKCLLLLIRGTHSIKDAVTAATGTVVPFHHSVLHDGGISNLVLGYAHCGMVAAARWIARLSTPYLLQALGEYPEYNVKIVGHSLGGGTAALLTYILREQKGFSSCTCFTFAPAACMTWDLAESGKHFITTLINGSDLVPTFSAASVDDLHSELTQLSRLKNWRDQVKHGYRSATAWKSRLHPKTSAKARVVGAGGPLHTVSNSTQVVMNDATNVAESVVKTSSSLSSWFGRGRRRHTVSPLLNSKVEDGPEAPLKLETCSATQVTMEGITEGELWYELWHELEKELEMQENEVNLQAQEEEAAAIKEITEEEDLAEASESKTPISSSDVTESHHFYPPGRIMHIVSLSSPDTASLDGAAPIKERVGIYQTPRKLYGEIHLSRTMINDHYMRMYKENIELLIRQLENE